jgi:hypothetical protein
VPGDEIASHELAHGGRAGQASEAGAGEPAPGAGGPDAVPPASTATSLRGRPIRLSIRRHLRHVPGLWLSIFGVSLGLFLVRFLVPVPVGQADNRDGPRLMCGVFGLGPAFPRGHPRFFRYAYFEYVPLAGCGRSPYATSQIVPLEVTRLLTPVFGLPGSLNLIALGVLMCVLASIAIASLAVGLRVRPWAQLLVAAVIWLIMADAAFFDLFASPFSEPAVLVGLLLVAVGLVYLGRGRRASALGLVLAGPGGLAVVLSKEEYLFLAVPICIALVLASTSRGSGPGLRRFLTPQTAAAVAVAAVLAVSAAGYAVWNARSSYGQRTQPMRVVDTIFERIVNGHDNERADLRTLGLPASWSRYAGSYYWARRSVRTDPLYHRYEPKLTDGNLARFWLTHPGRAIEAGQQAAAEDQSFRATALGDYPPAAGHRPGALDSRVTLVTWLVQQLPRQLGLLWLGPQWAAMAVIALLALRQRRRLWHRDGAVLVLCMTGCAIVAFIPPAYFDGISTARHMVGLNLATALAFAFSIALAASMTRQALRTWHHQGSGG